MQGAECQGPGFAVNFHVLLIYNCCLAFDLANLMHSYMYKDLQIKGIHLIFSFFFLFRSF